MKNNLIVPVMVLLLASCGGTMVPRSVQTPAIATKLATPCVPVGQWYDPGRGEILSGAETVKNAADASIVLLGEVHASAEHHRWQLQTLAALFSYQPHMSLAFEAFPRRLQSVLDDWTAGKLTEQEFLAKSEWDHVWGYPAELYLPLFHFARMNRIPMVALNVNRQLVQDVRRDGWAAVPPAQREGVGNPSGATQRLKASLLETYMAHLAFQDKEKDQPKPETPDLDNPEFLKFMQSMQLWDRAMAEALDKALTDRPLIVGIVGLGHLQYGDNISYQLADIGNTDVRVFIPWDDGMPCQNLQSKDGTPVASAVFGVTAMAPETAGVHGKGPRLGVMITDISEEGTAGVRILKVLEGSVASQSGLMQDDIIQRAAGTAVRNKEQLIKTIKRQPLGTWLPMEILRDGKMIEIIGKFPAS